MFEIRIQKVVDTGTVSQYGRKETETTVLYEQRVDELNLKAVIGAINGMVDVAMIGGDRSSTNHS